MEIQKRSHPIWDHRQMLQSWVNLFGWNQKWHGCGLPNTMNRWINLKKFVFLVLVYVCKKFSDYVLGKNILLKTAQIISVPPWDKSLDALPPRVLHCCIHLMRFQYSISHVPGKTFYIPDTLSRTLLSASDANGVNKDTELFVQAVISGIPASKDYLEVYRKLNHKKQFVCSYLH